MDRARRDGVRTPRTMHDIDSWKDYNELPEPIQRAMHTLFCLHINSAKLLRDD